MFYCIGFLGYFVFAAQSVEEKLDEHTIKVSVTVEDGAVTDIEILEENETPCFLERAIAVIEDILVKQSLDVDAVSGATYSSVGIINAVNNALEPAIVDGELEKSETELPENGHHGHGGHKKRPSES